jgi:predicted signal transduction protein with EAL and GGDEF domain
LDIYKNIFTMHGPMSVKIYEYLSKHNCWTEIPQLMEVRGQLHAPETSALEKENPVPSKLETLTGLHNRQRR